LESTLQRDVGGAATHQPHEVVVLLGGVAVRLDVADALGVALARAVEAEARLQPGLDGLEVAVDRFGRANDHRLQAVLLEVLAQHAGVGVGVVAADDQDAVEVELLGGAACTLELLGIVDLVPARADHVEATLVAVPAAAKRRPDITPKKHRPAPGQPQATGGGHQTAAAAQQQQHSSSSCGWVGA
jgi:hypothetical protein